MAVRFAAKMLPENKPLPWTERDWDGEVVPIPTFPPDCASQVLLKVVSIVVEAFERFNNPEKVDEAVLANKYAPVPETVSWVVEAFPKVVRPVTFKVPVADIFEAVRFSLKNPLPATESLTKGLVVPIPTFPIRDESPET